MKTRFLFKVKLFISAMGGEVSLKLPFTLMHSNVDPDLVGFPSPVREAPKEFEKSTNEVAEKSDSSSGHRNEENKLEIIKEQESRVTDVDLIEHCEESDSTWERAQRGDAMLRPSVRKSSDTKTIKNSNHKACRLSISIQRAWCCFRRAS